MHHPLRTASTILVACAAALAPAGCRLLGGPAPNYTQYLLAPPAMAAVAGPKLGSISIREFTAISPFDMSAFVYRNTDGSWRIDPYDGFAADPSEMIAAALVDAFDASTRFDLVAYDALAARTDLLLEGVIEDFHSDFQAAGAHESMVRLRVYISRRHGGRRGVVFSTVAEGRAAIAAQTPGAVAEALSAATGVALDKIVKALPERLPEMPMHGEPDAPAAKL